MEMIFSIHIAFWIHTTSYYSHIISIMLYIYIQNIRSIKLEALSMETIFRFLDAHNFIPIKAS